MTNMSTKFVGDTPCAPSEHGWQYDALVAQRDHLTAQVERLRGALEDLVIYLSADGDLRLAALLDNARSALSHKDSI